MNRIWSTFRFSLRMAMRSQFNTVLSICVLAGGIALAISSYRFYEMAFASTVPYTNSERLAVIELLTPSGNHHSDWPLQTLCAFRERQNIFEKILPYVPDSLSIRSDAGDTQAQGVYVDPEMFGIIGQHPVLGRAFAEKDGRPDSERVAILSHRLWQRMFNGSSGVIGKTIVTDGTVRTIIGVMHEGFDGPFPVTGGEIWLPLNLDTVTRETGWARNADLLCIARPRIPRGEVERQTNAVAMEAVKAFPHENDNVVAASVRYLNDAHIKDSERKVLYTVFLCACLILLMSCGIVSGLLTARYSGRAQEIAIRASLGASRAQIVGQMMVEFLVISCPAVVLGFLLSHWFDVSMLGRFYERFHIPPFMRETNDAKMTVFLVGLLCAVTLVSTLVPALRASRADLNSVLRESQRTGSSKGMAKLSNFLITWQVATAFVVLFGGVMVGNCIYTYNHLNMRFDPDDYSVFRIAFNAHDHDDYEARCREVIDLIQAIEGSPGIEKACVTNELFNGNQWAASWNYVWIDGGTYASDNDVPLAFKRVVSPGYLDAMNIPLLAGRDFTAEDRYARQVVIVSEGFARQHYGTIDVLGKRFRLRRDGDFFSIVGVVPEVFNPTDDPSAQYGFFRPYATEPGNDVDIFVKSSGSFEDVRKTVTGIIKSVDNRICVVDALPYTEAKSRNGQASFLGFLLVLFATFTACAMVMTAGGLYGIISFSANVRRTEVGIRLSLGANPSGIVILMTKIGLGFVAIGLTLGVLGSLLLHRIMARQFYDVGPALWIYVGAALVIVAVSCVSLLVPAYRIARCEPSRFMSE